MNAEVELILSTIKQDRIKEFADEETEELINS